MVFKRHSSIGPSSFPRRIELYKKGVLCQSCTGLSASYPSSSPLNGARWKTTRRAISMWQCHVRVRFAFNIFWVAAEIILRLERIETNHSVSCCERSFPQMLHIKMANDYWIVLHFSVLSQGIPFTDVGCRLLLGNSYMQGESKKCKH